MGVFPLRREEYQKLRHMLGDCLLLTQLGQSHGRQPLCPEFDTVESWNPACAMKISPFFWDFEPPSVISRSNASKSPQKCSLIDAVTVNWFLVRTSISVTHFLEDVQFPWLKVENNRTRNKLRTFPSVCFWIRFLILPKTWYDPKDDSCTDMSRIRFRAIPRLRKAHCQYWNQEAIFRTNLEYSSVEAGPQISWRNVRVTLWINLIN